MPPVPPLLVLGLGAFLVVFLLLLALRPAPRPVAARDDLAPARRYVDRQIDEHLDELARHAEQARAVRAGIEPFAEAIETFIAHILAGVNQLAEDDDLDLKVRELVVLEREYVYARIMARVHGAGAAEDAASPVRSEPEDRV
jgi:hypothetical protein